MATMLKSAAGAPFVARPKNDTLSRSAGSGSETLTLNVGEVVCPVAPLVGVFSTGMFGAWLKTRLKGAPATRVHPLPLIVPFTGLGVESRTVVVVPVSLSPHRATRSGGPLGSG